MAVDALSGCFDSAFFACAQSDSLNMTAVKGYAETQA
jgi:hypothetical protein